MSSYANSQANKTVLKTKFLEDFKLPQFFKESAQQIKLRKRLEKEYQINLMKAKDEVGLLGDPDLLI